MNEQESRRWHPRHMGWSTDILPFFDRVGRELPRGATYVEVGVFLGRSLAFMGELRPDVKLVAIDPWEDVPSRGYDGPGEFDGVIHEAGGLYKAFLEQMMTFSPDVLRRARIVPARSVAGMLSLAEASVDMVFIDGAHDTESVTEDIRAAQRILKPGGLLSGHDFCGENGVMEAVLAILGQPNLEPWADTRHPGWLEGHSTCWWVRT